MLNEKNSHILRATTAALVAQGKGLLAMDESNQTCNKRFELLGIAAIEENRRAWRELIITTPTLNKHISGVILYDETIRQQKQNGHPLSKVITESGMLIGIKVDTGAKEMAGHEGEKIAEGLDGLRERLKEYAQIGARFAKWRAVITIGEGIPSSACIAANASALARYAALCQEANLVPIIEPEVLMNGAHSLAQCAAVTEAVLREVFSQLSVQSVVLEAMILKPNMVLAGLDNLSKATIDEEADATVTCLMRTVPAAVPGIAFLSGGQSGKQASQRLNTMNSKFGSRLPWALTFSFSRAIQQKALAIWRGKDSNREAAQSEILFRAKCNHAARLGIYTDTMEQMYALAQTSSPD
jgi:fructose-bisphosphate aldolase, class I